MYAKLVEQAQVAVGDATKRLQAAEKALADVRAIRLSASAVAGIFTRYSEQRATAHAAYVDKMLVQAAEQIDTGAVDLLMYRHGTDSDAVHFFLQEAIAAGIEARCKKLFPANGETVDNKAAKVRKAEQALAAARDAYSDAVSALRRLRADPATAVQHSNDIGLLHGA